MSFFHALTSEGPYDVIWGIGDSHTVKRNPTGTSYGPTPTANTVFQWDVATQTLYEIGATDILQSGSGANWGSIWPQMGISYNTYTGKKPVFVTGGVGGTNYAPRTGDSGDWSAADTIYSSAKTELDNCLAYLGKKGPRYIVVNLGVNDGRGTTALATIQTEITAFYTKLHTDYPNAIILQIMMGRNETEVSTARAIAIRNYIRNEAETRDYMHIIASETALWSNSYYDSDNLHLLQTGNNIVGEMFGRWLQNRTYSKWARSIIASHFDALSTARKDLIEDWVTDMGSLYFDLDFFYNQHTTIEANTFFDWTFQLGGFKTSATFTANDCITTNGTSSYWRPDHDFTRAVHSSQNDGFIGVKIKTNRSAAGGSTRVALGRAAAAEQAVVGQTNLSLTYHRYNDLTLSNGTETKLADDSYYSSGRSGTTKILYKNGVADNSVTQASTGLSSGTIYQGALNNAGVAGNFLDCDFQYCIGGLLGGVSQVTIYNACEALIDSW